jgi:GAF domain-containing protein
VQEVPRGDSLCSLAILKNDTTVFVNALDEPCLLASPIVAGKFGLRFYAGHPLVTNDGFPIGTFCIVDKAPRPFSPEDEQVLQHLASLVMCKLEDRKLQKKNFL